MVIHRRGIATGMAMRVIDAARIAVAAIEAGAEAVIGKWWSSGTRL
eukprot:COSAG06_NODE_600_length_13896_cov_3.494020_6_plen_46_part_00